MALVTIFVFIVWMYQVQFLVALFLGLHASFSTLQQFITVVLTTSEGLAFFIIGNLIGAALSLMVFSLTAVSFPLLLDRDDVDFVTAMITSVRAVTTSPVPMIGWGLIIVVLLIVSILPLPRPANHVASIGAHYLASLPTHCRDHRAGVSLAIMLRLSQRHVARRLDRDPR